LKCLKSKNSFQNSNTKEQKKLNKNDQSKPSKTNNYKINQLSKKNEMKSINQKARKFNYRNASGAWYHDRCKSHWRPF
jgi:hypothetical protein